MKLPKTETIELDMDEWDRDILEYLIKESCHRDISVNEVICEVLEQEISKA